VLIPGARSAHERHDEAQDPRQSRSDTSPPISQATARPPIGRRRETTHPIFLRETETGTKLSLLHAPSRKPGQNSPCSTCPHPNRDKTLPAPRALTQTGTKLSLHRQNGPNSTFLGEQGEFCHGNAPTSVRLANFVPDDAPKPLRQARSIRPSAVRSHVNPLAHTSTGYSIDGQAPHTGPARPGCGARGRWRGLAGLRDRSLRAEGSRVAISRAGRRPRAHKAARPWPRAHKAARPWPRAHTAARRLHEHITRPRPVTRPRPRE